MKSVYLNKIILAIAFKLVLTSIFCFFISIIYWLSIKETSEYVLFSGKFITYKKDFNEGILLLRNAPTERTRSIMSIKNLEKIILFNRFTKRLV